MLLSLGASANACLINLVVKLRVLNFQMRLLGQEIFVGK
jgi:hypothetical protein